MNKETRTFQIPGYTIILYVVLSMACYFILAAVFEFPDVLRMSGSYRFSLFQANQQIIVPVYYLWTMTGLLQILMSLMLFGIPEKQNGLDRTALVFGILCGVFQIIGFSRWVVLIPLLSDARINGGLSQELVFFAERAANGYLGMTLGEHMGNFFLGLWVLLLSWRMLTFSLVPKSLALLGILSGGIFFLFSFEALGGMFSFLSAGTVAAWGLLYVWILLLALALFRYRPGETVKPFHWGIWVGAVVFWLSNVIPSFG